MTNSRMFLQSLQVLKEYSDYRLQRQPNHSKHPHNAWYVHYRSCLKTKEIYYKNNYTPSSGQYIRVMHQSQCSFILLSSLMRKYGYASIQPTSHRPVHRGPTTNEIFPRLTHMSYITLADASSSHCNLKLDEKSSYLTPFAHTGMQHNHIVLP